MKKNTMAVILAFIILILVFFFYTESKKSKEEVSTVADLEVNSDIIADPPPPVTTNNGITQGYQLYSTEDGLGYENIQRQVEKLMNDSSLRSSITDTLTLNYFAGLSKPDLWRNYILTQNGFTNESDIPLVPSSVNNNFTERLEEIEGFNMTSNIDQIGRSTATGRYCDQLMDFGNIEYAGFRLCPDRGYAADKWIDDNSGYGNCNSVRCKERNWASMGKDGNKLAANMLRATKQFEAKANEWAIQKLRSTGWHFEGYDPPSN